MGDQVVFNETEWALINTWTAENEEQEGMLSCGPDKVTPGVAIAILCEMTTEGAIDDQNVHPIVRKLGQLISNFAGV
jgi:hypothetical protein